MKRKVGSRRKTFGKIIILFGVLHLIGLLAISLPMITADADLQLLAVFSPYIIEIPISFSLLGLFLYSLGDLAQRADNDRIRQEQAERLADERWATAVAWMERQDQAGGAARGATPAQPAVQPTPQPEGAEAQPQA